MRIRNLVINSSIILTTLLVFLLFFEQRVVLPPWLQMVGRLHPMLLHFPVVLLIGYGVLLVYPYRAFREAPYFSSITDGLLLAALSSTSLTAVGGFFLSLEKGYDPADLFWHKWAGVLLTLFVGTIYIFRQPIRARQPLRIAVTVATFGGIFFTGHQGAGITHGQNFLFAPILPEKTEPMVSLEEAEVFAHVIQPILDAKCVNCHNSSKAKGELIMETAALLKKGGKTGPLWDLQSEDLGLLMQRIHLPIEHKKHMPPQGKPQLTEEESMVLFHWIKSGAAVDQRVAGLPVTDTLRLLAEQFFSSKEGNAYSFAAAADKTIASLNTPHRVLYSIAKQSPALAVNFYNKEFFSESSLRDLLAVKDQLVEMDLSRMPVNNELMVIVAQFSQVRRLTLNFTSITGKGLLPLQSHKQLQYLSLSGTGIKKEDVSILEKIKTLKKVVLWNTAISFDELAQLKKQTSRIAFEIGYRGDTVVLPLTPPILQNEETVITGAVPLRMKHYVNGAIIRYTTDGSDPDSIRSPVYNENMTIEGNTLLKARAFKAGWTGSEPVQQYFYKSTYQPDTSFFLTQPDPKYVSYGSQILFNKIKGELFNFASGQWLGYRENKMETLLQFKQAISVEQVMVSCLVLPGSYIMPPVRVEVWGGSDPKKLQRLGSARPVALTKMEAASNLPVDIRFTPQTVSYLKVIVVPLPKLPGWHPGKGEKGWAFLDEVFIN